MFVIGSTLGGTAGWHIADESSLTPLMKESTVEHVVVIRCRASARTLPGLRLLLMDGLAR